MYYLSYYFDAHCGFIFQLIFYLDGGEVNRMTLNHKIRFIKEDFNVGGHKNPTEVTGGVVTSSFIGTIKDVIVNSTGFDTEFDIFLEMWKDQFPGKLSF